MQNVERKIKICNQYDNLWFAEWAKKKVNILTYKREYTEKYNAQKENVTEKKNIPIPPTKLLRQ